MRILPVRTGLDNYWLIWRLTDYMNKSDDERDRALKRKFNKLLADWKQNNGPCIICGEKEGNEEDDLPPKVLYPRALRNSKTFFYKFPACSDCNRGSSNEDFLMSLLLTFWLNQDAYLKNVEPTDPDLLALHKQAESQCQNSSLAVQAHIRKLLQTYAGNHPVNGMPAINIDKVPINRTLTKIVKAIYWLETGGDILQKYNPGWWIMTAIDASKETFIEKHLKLSSSNIMWEDKFISHHSIGGPKSGADGFISCSLHFYSNRSAQKGMHWLLIAAPDTTRLNNDSLFELCANNFGKPTIRPRLCKYLITHLLAALDQILSSLGISRKQTV